MVYIHLAEAVSAGILEQMIDELWHLFFGSLCLLCRESVTGTDARRQLCPYCLAELPWLERPDVEIPPDNLYRTIAAFEYADIARQWVLDAKREQGLVSARMLGTLLAETVRDVYPFATERPDALVPVPLSFLRLMHRGHNQAELIAAPVSRGLHIPVLRLVTRIRNTPIQPGLDQGARRANVLHAFRVRSHISGLRIAIVDDVVTTGATASALAGVLLEAGAGEVELWCATSALKTDFSSALSTHRTTPHRTTHRTTHRN